MNEKIKDSIKRVQKYSWFFKITKKKTKILITANQNKFRCSPS